MPNVLTDIELDEVSLVDDPASIGADVLVFKRNTSQAAEGEVVLPTLFDPNPGSLRQMTTVTKTAAEPGIVSFRKSNDSVETVEIAKSDYMEAAEMAGQEADDGISPVMEQLHQVVQQIAAANAPPEQKAQAITKSFQEAMQVLTQEMMGDDDQPGFIEKCLVTGATLVKNFGVVPPKADADNSNSESGAAGDKVEKKDDTMADSPEVAELRKSLQDMKDQLRLEEIRKDLTGAKIPLENAEVLLTLEKASPDSAAAMLKSLKALAAQVNHGSMTQEIGAAGGDDNVRKAASTRLDTAVSEIKKNHPKLSNAQAFAKALDTDPELAAAYDRGEL